MFADTEGASDQSISTIGSGELSTDWPATASTRSSWTQIWHGSSAYSATWSNWWMAVVSCSNVIGSTASQAIRRRKLDAAKLLFLLLNKEHPNANRPDYRQVLGLRQRHDVPILRALEVQANPRKCGPAGRPIAVDLLILCVEQV